MEKNRHGIQEGLPCLVYLDIYLKHAIMYKNELFKIEQYGGAEQGGITVNLLENYSAGTELYARICDKVCTKYQMTRAEFHVLMFLANNPECSTATEIVKKRYLSKSHVSLSVRTLQERGYIFGEYRGMDRRTVHLKVCDAAAEAVADGRKAQEEFAAKLLEVFTDEEKQQLKLLIGKITENIVSALK